MIKLNEKYSDYVDMSDPDYPNGKAINASSSESYDGTPILADLLNDVVGSHQAMYKKAYGNITGISGKPDSVSNSQFADAVVKLVYDKTKEHADKRGLADGVHGAVYEAIPGQIAARNELGNIQVADAVYDKDAVNFKLLSELSAVVDGKSPLAGSSSLVTCSKGNFGSAATKTVGSGVGSVPLVGSALGNTNNNIVVTDTSGNLKSAGVSVSKEKVGFKVLGGTTSKVLTVPENYTLAAACAKGVDTTASIVSANVPTTGMAIASGNGGAVCSVAANIAVKTVALNGFALYDGVTVKVMFRFGNNKENPALNVNNTGAFNIVVPRNGRLYRPVNHAGHWGGGSVVSQCMWDVFTTLELMYLSGKQTVYNASDKSEVVNGVWVVMGNPTVNSWHNNTDGYEVKANGLVEQWGYSNYTAIVNHNNIIRVNFNVTYDFIPSISCMNLFSAENSGDWYPEIEVYNNTYFVYNTRKVSIPRAAIFWSARGY